MLLLLDMKKRRVSIDSQLFHILIYLSLFGVMLNSLFLVLQTRHLTLTLTGKEMNAEIDIAPHLADIKEKHIRL
jgi:hypothetical protein